MLTSSLSLPSHRRLALVGAALLLTGAVPVLAQPQVASPAMATYADLATLADAAPLAVRATVKDQVTVKPERAPGLAAGYARLYIEARTIALLAGSAPLGESLRYLVDVPLDAKGKVPKFKKKDVILFARAVPSRPGELQLVAPDAQLPWSQQLEARLRPILTAFASPDAPPRVTGIRDAMSSAGNLAGESETQIFLETAENDPAALTIIRRPGMAPRWGVSFAELVDQSARPPAPGTLGWYRLACALPADLPESAIYSDDATDRARAQEDYAFVMDQLGACERTRS